MLNAALVGANTVKGPGPCSVSTRPAAFTAATSVVWSFEFIAFWMMFFEGYIGAPPTVTVCSPICALVGVAATAAKTSVATATAVGRVESFMSMLHVLSPPQRLAHEVRSTGRADAAHGYFSLAAEGPSGLQARELAAGDDRSGRLSGGGSAGRPKRHRECCVRGEATGEIGRDGEADRLARLDEPERARLLVWQDQPQLDGARIIGQQRCRHYEETVAGCGDGGDEIRLAAASGERCHQRRPRGRDETEISERRDARGRKRRRGDAKAAPEREALPQRCGPRGRRGWDRSLDLRPGMPRRRDRRDRVGKHAQPLLPERNLGSERRLLRQAALDLAPLVGSEHAQHIFSGDELAAVRRVNGVVVAHRSRQALSFNNPRRIQLFIVPRGTFMRAANSS